MIFGKLIYAVLTSCWMMAAHRSSDIGAVLDAHMQEEYHPIANNCKDFCYKFCMELLNKEQLKVDPLPFGSFQEFVIQLEGKWEHQEHEMDQMYGRVLYTKHATSQLMRGR